MKWAFWKADPLTDPALLEEVLSKPNMKESVLAHVQLLEDLGRDMTAEALTELAVEQSCDEGTTLLMVALAGHMGLIT